MSDAVEWYQRAAEQGHMGAKKELGVYYYDMAKRCKTVFDDETRGFYKKMIIVPGIAMILLAFEKPIAIIVEFVIFAAVFLIKRSSFKNMESYQVMVDYLYKAAELGHKGAKRALRFWG